MGIEVPTKHKFRCLKCHTRQAYYIRIDDLEGQHCDACGSETLHERKV